jgi:TonB-dependent starch-binding outer membrane protein SusC
MLKRLLVKMVLPLCMVLCALVANAQNKTITGKVVDAKDGSGVPSVTVTAKGSKNGTQTGADGSFSISVPASTSMLVLSSVGYASQEVDISGKTDVNISLIASSATNLNEVVVVGYGTARRKDLVGAVTSINSKDFNKGIVQSPDQLIQGKVAGVQVTANSGDPSGGISIRIRGSSSIRSDNTPLFVVDGVQLSNTDVRPSIGLTDVGGGTPGGNPLNFINPSDIASMEILKDASATAIYGSRGANGVVLITTKRGLSGQPRVDVAMSYGVASIAKKLEVLSGDQYRTALGEYGFPTAVSTTATPTANFGGSVNALEGITRNGIQQNYSVGMSGGNENARYRLSLGYLNQEGIIRKSDFEKYTVSLNANFKLLESKKLGLDVNVLAARVSSNNVPISNTAGFKGSLIGQALQWNPTRPFYKSPGVLDIQFGSDNINPLAYSEAYNDIARTTSIIANISPSYQITDNLIFKTQISLTQATGTRKAYTTANININDIALNTTTGKGGEATVAQNELTSSQITNTLSFTDDISSGLNLNAVVGHEYLSTNFEGSSDYARGFIPTDKAYYLFMATSDPSTRRVGGFADPQTELQSFFGRVFLNYKDKYTLNATVRADGSSKFGSNNRYGIFPMFGASWILSNEDFLKGVSAVKDLKLRASWGITGNQAFPAGASQILYTLSGGNPATFQQSQIANPNLKWESTTTFNVGVDFTLFGKVSGSIDYFNKSTKDILFPREAADPVTPNGSIKWENIPGNIVNSGLELQLNANILKGSNYSLDLGLNMTFLKNELTNFGALQLPTGEINGQGLSGAYAQLLVDGKALNSYYLKKFTGIDKTTGISTYEGGEDKFFLGSANPTTLLGFTINASYDKFSLQAAFNGNYGHFIYNNTNNAITAFNNLGKRNIGLTEYNTGKALGEKPVNPTSASSRYLEKGDFLRLSNLTLSYNIGALGKTLRSANVFITGQNLFVITDFTGFDPEVNVSKSLNNIPSFGMEYTPYPMARIINFGVNFSL